MASPHIAHIGKPPVMGLVMDSLVTEETFEESAYLASNPDVAAAVKRGDLESGRKHFKVFGA